MNKRMISFILALVLLMGMLPVQANATEHGDMFIVDPTCTEEGYTFYNCDICGVSYKTDRVAPLGHDFVDGVCSRCSMIDHGAGSSESSNGIFAPETRLTRGFFIYALWCYFGCPEPASTDNPWEDVDESDYFYEAIFWAYENSIANGISATEFGPEKNVNRGQAVTYLWRAFGSPEAFGVNPFVDVANDAFFYVPVIWAYHNGFMTTLDAEDTFKPYDMCYYGHINWDPSFSDHTHEYTAVVTDPTCTKQGYTTYICTICLYQYQSDYVSALGHEYESEITTAPTCSKKGRTTYTCSVCSHSYAEDDVDPLGHDFVDGVCSRCSMIDPSHGGTVSTSDPCNGMFAPDQELTRGMFCYALWNFFSSPEPASMENPFTDLRESDYYYKAVLWVYENGITSGMSATQFGTDRTVNRAQAATWLWRAFGSPDAPDENPFIDVYEGAFFYEAAIWVCAEGYMAPLDSMVEFEPNETCYYGYINWIPADHPHRFTAEVTEPTCTEGGCTTYTCTICGYSCTARYVEALGHEFAEGRCINCGETDPDYVAPPPFGDVPTDEWYYAPVLWAVENGITNGTSGDSFSPDDKCLRAHVVTFLWRAANCPEPESTDCTFTDVTENDFFYEPVLWAVENGITNGTGTNTFGSYDVCNRAAVVTFLWRAFGSPEPDATESSFTDVSEGDFYYKAVLWAVEKGITNGLTATEFGPTEPCNRAQVVTFLYRACSD